MKKLTKEQKDLVIKKLEESGQFPGLVEKAKKDPESGLSDKEWDKARKKAVANMMRESDSRFFKVASLVSDGVASSTKLAWAFDNKDTIGLVMITVGAAMMMLDPGTFAPRGATPKISGILDYLRLVNYLLNWGIIGWGGALSATLGYLWSRHPKLFID